MSKRIVQPKFGKTLSKSKIRDICPDGDNAYGKLDRLQTRPISHDFTDKTCCPACHEFIEPNACAIYNSDYRFLCIMESSDGPKKCKSERKEFDNCYYRFNVEKMFKWIS